MLNEGFKKRVIFSAFFIVTLTLFFFSSDFFIIHALTAIAALSLFYLTDYLFNIKFELKHYIFAVVIVFSGLILSPLYSVYPNYDKLLHFILPILFSSIAFRMLHKFDLGLRWKILFVFFIVVGTLGLFEIGEFTLDFFFDLKTQGVYLRDTEGINKLTQILDPNTDTMLDMIDGALGALTYVIASGINWMIYQKTGKKLKNKR